MKLTIPKGKLARMERRLRQIDLALQTGIAQPVISLIENGLKEPTPEQARKLNAALKLEVYREGKR